MFHSFFNSLAKSRYLSFFSLSFRFILGPPGQQSRQFYQFSFFSSFFFFFFFLLIIMRSGLLTGIRWSVCMLKSHRSLCKSFSLTGAGLCIYHLFSWSNWNFLHISQWTNLPTHNYYYYYYYYYYFCFRQFFISVLTGGFSLEFGNSKFRPVSRTLLSILGIIL